MAKIKNIFFKYHRSLIIAITVVLFIASLVNLFFITEVVPTSNDECLWEYTKSSTGEDGEMRSRIQFDKVKFEGVTWDAGIRDGDILLEINGTKVNTAMHAQYILNSVPEGHYARYTYERDGQVYKTKVYVKKLISFGNLGFAIMSLIWLIVAFVVIMAKNDGYPQRVFYRVAIAFTIYSFGGGFLMGYEGLNPIFGYDFLLAFIGVVWTIGASFLPFLLIQFFWIFPNELEIIKHKWVKKALYIIPSILIVISIGLRVFIYSTQNENVAMKLGSMNFYLVFGAMIIGLVSLFINYSRIESKKQRTPIFVILIAYSLAIVSLIYSVFFAELLADDIIFNSPEYFTPIILVCLIPIAFGYSVFKYSLLDVSDVIKNTILYGLATITLAACYFVLIYVLGQGLSSVFESEYEGFLAALLFIFFAFVFQSSKDKLQNLLTKKFYPEQFAYQKVLTNFSNEVTSIVGLENIYDYIYKTFVVELRLGKFALLMKNEDNVCKLEKSEGIVENISLNCSSDEIVHYIEEKKSYGLSQVINREDFQKIFKDDSDQLIRENIYNVIPMIIKSKLKGLILIGLKYTGSRYSGKDLSLLIAASSQVAVALENARLYEMEADKLKIERDLENARIIQSSLLPSRIPKIQGLDISGTMIPAMQVGGDYYDVIKVSEDKVFVIVGDVSGKGLSASFYMTKLQTMMQLFCNPDRNPKDVLIEVNKRIYESIEKNWFITISVALFDLKENKVKFCRAGHTPLLLAENGSISQIQSDGLGVGLENGKIFDKTIEEVEFNLKKGQRFTFFSDGVNETMNNNNELYGMKRLLATLDNCKDSNASYILNSIIMSLENYRSKAVQNDDVTLVQVNVD